MSILRYFGDEAGADLKKKFINERTILHFIGKLKIFDREDVAKEVLNSLLYGPALEKYQN